MGNIELLHGGSVSIICTIAEVSITCTIVSITCTMVCVVYQYNNSTTLHCGTVVALEHYYRATLISIESNS